TVTVRLAPLPPNTMFAFGTSVVFDELPVTVRLAAGVSASSTVNAIAPVVESGAIVCGPIAEMVGTWSTDVTVITNVEVADRPPSTAVTVSRNVVGVDRVPSLPVTVIAAVPYWSRAGVTVTVRLAPLPPNTRFAFGTRVVFDELPDTVRLPAAVRLSPTVNAIA